MPGILRNPKILVACLALLLVAACGSSDQDGADAQYVVPDTAGQATGQAQVLTEALRKRGLVCSDLYPDYKPIVVRGCYRKDATHDVKADFTATPDGQLVSASLGADYSWPADYRQAPTELEAIVEDFAAAGAAGKLADLLVKADNKSNVQLTTAWGTVSLIGTSAVELNRKGWKWPELPDNSFTGTAEQVASAVTADGFTCTSSNGGGVQNCDRGPDLVTAISGPDGIHTIAIRAGSWTAARTLQEHIFQALPGDAEQTGDRKPLASRWFAAGEASGARAYVDGLLLCQTRYSSSTVFGISALVPAGTTSGDC